MTTPTPGQPLSEADVSLLQPGDWLLHKDGTVHRILSAIEGWVFVADWREPIRAFTFLGRPDQDGWIFNPEGWAENPVPGVTIEYRCRSGSTWALPVSLPSEALRWGNSGWSGDIIAYRPHAPVSRPGDGVEGSGPLGEVPDSALKIATDLHAAYEQLIYGLPKYLDAENLTDEENMIREAYITLDVTAHRLAALTPPAEPVSRPAEEGEREAVAWPVVTDQWAETYCELTGRDPDGQQVTFVDGGTVTTFRDMARREIEAMLCAAPKSAVRTIATAEPAEARIRELERQLRIVQNAAKTLHHCRDTELQHLRENATFDHRLRAEHESLMERDAMMTDLLEQAEVRATAAEAKLARAVEGLRWIAEHREEPGGPPPDDEMQAIARQTLAALQQKGE